MCGEKLKDELMSLCVFVVHIWRQLQMLSSGSSAKHSWSQWRSWKGEPARGKRGSLRLPWLECGFSITRKLFGRDSGITRCSLKPRGREWSEDQKQRGKSGRRLQKQPNGVRAADGSSGLERWPGLPGPQVSSPGPASVLSQAGGLGSCASDVLGPV